jgi:hypothetical protein
MNEIEALKIKAHEEWAALSWEHPEREGCASSERKTKTGLQAH